jgi:ribosomal protein S13
MARLVGVDLPRDKRIEVALTYIFGVGRTRALETLQNTGVSGDKRVHELGDDELVKLRDWIEGNYKIEGDLRREVTADREALAVAAALIAADLDLPTDVGLDLAAEVTLDLDVGAIDGVAELDQLLVTQLVDSQVGVDPGGCQHFLGAGTADAVDVGERDLDALVAREVDTDEACHWRSFSVSRSGFGRVAPLPASGGPRPLLRGCFSLGCSLVEPVET